MARHDGTGQTHVIPVPHLTKTALRALVRERLRSLSRAALPQLSAELCSVLRAQGIWRTASSVLLFAPLDGEPDISPLLEEAAAGRLLLPRFNVENGTYEACSFRNRAELVAGAFGVLEPAADCPVVSLNQLDLVLVPGLAFDLAGRRLGRGKGFYDRLLAEVRGHKCGVAFDAQIVSEVPEEPHDVRVNSILTPTFWRPCPSAD